MVSKEEKELKEDLKKAGIKPKKTSSFGVAGTQVKEIGRVSSKVLEKGALSGPGFKPTRPVAFDQTYSKEQSLLRSMFGGRPFLINPEESNPPNIHGAMMKGGGILKNGDYGRQTARMFGMR